MEFMSQTFMVLDKNLNQVHVFLYAVSGFKCGTLYINYFHSMLFYDNQSQIQENPDISNRQNFYGHSEREDWVFDKVAKQIKRKWLLDAVFGRLEKWRFKKSGLHCEGASRLIFFAHNRLHIGYYKQVLNYHWFRNACSTVFSLLKIVQK